LHARPSRTLDFADHGRTLDAELRYVYAVVSRRAAGLSIGVNLQPCQDCNFDCGYCQVRRTGGRRPPEIVDIARLEKELRSLLERAASPALWTVPPFDTVAPALRRVADVAFAGDGEPTASPLFPEALDLALDLRDQICPSPVPVRVLSNASLFHKKAVSQALGRLPLRGGEVWAKLDAGTEEQFRRINRAAIPFSRILANIALLARQQPIVIQSLLAAVDGQGPTIAEIDAWIARLGEIVRSGGRIREVQVTTLARLPADPAFSPLPDALLSDIARRLTLVTGLPATVTGSLPPESKENP
jgi:wyosine [tRNA(Phe)-imidazoG37] synthetase (radical SAM superfamily)